MTYFMLFLAGALFCNCIPHLSCGLSGVPFPTPFAKPRGVGNSSPPVNFLWGALNLLVAILIAGGRQGTVETLAGLAAVAAGFLVLGLYLSMHFGRVRQAG